MFEEAAHSLCAQKFYQVNDWQLIAVTDAAGCPRPLWQQVERIAVSSYKPTALLLRAKNLSAEEYFLLAQQALPLCQKHHISLIVHTHWQSARRLGLKNLHLPLKLLAAMPVNERKSFSISSSVHSVAEARQALQLGAETLLAGHIYATDCKAKLPPRGLHFLRDICQTAATYNAQHTLNSKPPAAVYAIGGIKFDAAQWQALKAAGASGACIMSGYMHI